MSRRTLKAAQAIREVVSMAILTEIKDPRVADVTVTRVEVSGDMREAKVYVTVMGSESKQHLTLGGLRSSAGFLQQKISRRIDTRYTPRIEFLLDKGEMNAAELDRVFAKMAQERVDAEQGTTEEDTTDEDTTDEDTTDEDTTEEGTTDELESSTGTQEPSSADTKEPET